MRPTARFELSCAILTLIAASIIVSINPTIRFRLQTLFQDTPYPAACPIAALTVRDSAQSRDRGRTPAEFEAAIRAQPADVQPLLRYAARKVMREYRWFSPDEAAHEELALCRKAS